VVLVCDATALVALGGIDSIRLLRNIDRHLVISPWVRERELHRFSDQVDLGIAEGWLRVEEPGDSDVRGLMEAARSSVRLDRGEAETLIVAGYLAAPPTTILIDEGEAFRFVQDSLLGRPSTASWNLVCLAELLHQLEAGGNIGSASRMMQRLLDGDHYHWAPAVWVHYARQCEERGWHPVPKTPSQV
jgi:predicted nucleic acid-binding protein